MSDGIADSITVDGHAYPVIRRFGPDRALIDYDTTASFADLVAHLDCSPETWELSGQPASTDEERAAVKAWVDSHADSVTVTRDE